VRCQRYGSTLQGHQGDTARASAKPVTHLTRATVWFWTAARVQMGGTGLERVTPSLSNALTSPLVPASRATEPSHPRGISWISAVRHRPRTRPRTEIAKFARVFSRRTSAIRCKSASDCPDQPRKGFTEPVALSSVVPSGPCVLALAGLPVGVSRNAFDLIALRYSVRRRPYDTANKVASA